jgi:hypothetical protein
LQRSIRSIAADIRRHCSAHPRACDSLEGLSWWVQMQEAERFKRRVADAVKLLVEQRVLEAHRMSDGSEVYSCKTSSADAGELEGS